MARLASGRGANDWRKAWQFIQAEPLGRPAVAGVRRQA
jgi:hypothetical protein